VSSFRHGGPQVNQPKNTKRTTIYDLAQLAGTSASAVSAVLNGNWKKRRLSAKLAEKITQIAEEQGYALNMQASLLRREQSHIIGMIVPKYDNRYFGSIVEVFERMARERGLFPVITCTSRNPELELEAARTMLSYQVEWLISTGATDPDRITELCKTSGIKTLNLDLPGKLAPSVISDNFMGAQELTRRTLINAQRKYGRFEPLLFIGGRAKDHNTAERIRGFRAAHAALNVAVDESHILACGYAPEKAEGALRKLALAHDDIPRGMFVNSTISLEGVIRWLKQSKHFGDVSPTLGCFDWDPFVDMLSDEIEMVRQDVDGMLRAVFDIIDQGKSDEMVIELPPIFSHPTPAEE
jgi:LacI family fructose operon transcriptional repressor